MTLHHCGHLDDLPEWGRMEDKCLVVVSHETRSAMHAFWKLLQERRWGRVYCFYNETLYERMYYFADNSRAMLFKLQYGEALCSHR
jgi:hypothetical protein